MRMVVAALVAVGLAGVVSGLLAPGLLICLVIGIVVLVVAGAMILTSVLMPHS